MRIDIATLFPEMCETVLNTSIIGRAQKNHLVEIHCHNIRDYSPDPKHHRVDDTPYGGGKGMVMQPEHRPERLPALCHLPLPPGQDPDPEKVPGTAGAAPSFPPLRPL